METSPELKFAIEFEEACSDFQVPSTRAAAEIVLTRFRQIPKVLSICKLILDRAQSPMVQFQVALAIGEISVKEYTLYPLEELIQLKNYLIEYCLHHSKTPKYVRDQILSAVSLIIKRSLFDTTDEEKQAVYLHIKQLLTMDSKEAQIVGIALANSLTDQFSSTRSLTVGLTWEFHYKSKVFYEMHMLLPIFQETVTLLHSTVSHGSQSLPLTPSPLLSEILVLSEKILNWEFENNKNIIPGTFEKQENDDDAFDKEDGPSSVKATESIYPKEWQGVLGNNEVLWLFFMAYDLTQNDESLSHRCLQCLIKLSGIKEDFFNNDKEVIKSYSSTMIHGILKLVNSIVVGGTSPDQLSQQGPQLLATIQMTHRLFETTSLSTLCEIPGFYQFLNEIRQLTICCLHGNISDLDEGWIGEASDECLQTWVILDTSNRNRLSETDLHQLTEYMRNVSYQIVESYIQVQLERAKKVLDDEEEEDEIENAIKDWQTYGDQLTSIGILGRLNPHQCLLHLQHIINEKTSQFHAYFSSDMAVNNDIFIIHEQIHWIILLSAHVLADEGKGEQPMIPDSIMQLSASQTAEQDQVIQLSNQFLELLRFSSSFGPNSIEASNCSPRVAETLIWYMERWSKSYLLVNENDYGFMSGNIAKAYGQPGPSDGHGLQIIEFFIEQMKSNFMLWSADPDVLTQLIRWLNSCGTSLNLKTALIQSSSFPDLVKFITSNLEHLPEVVHNYLVQTIAIISSTVNDEAARNNYLNLIFLMIEERLGAILHQQDFSRNYQLASVMNNVLNGLDMFDGLALSCQFNNTAIIYSFISRFFQSFIQLMEIYKNVPEVQLSILQIVSDMMGSLDLNNLENTQKQVLYQFIIEIIRLYGTFNQGKTRVHTQEEEADKPYEDICTTLSLLNNVIATHFEGQQQLDGLIKPDAADVVIFGVNTIIPMINFQMLQIPNLCQSYIKLVSHLIEQFPDKLFGLPAPLFNNLMGSLEFGIRHAVAEINILTLQAVVPLGSWVLHHKYSQGNTEFIKEPISKLTSELLNVLLFQHLDASVVNIASDALLALICAEPETYISIVNHIISQQPKSLEPRLINAFKKLDEATPKLPPSITKDMAQSFKDYLLPFLMDVRAVLRVK
ncbi:armadillo-type protein [Cunninghamella echinulata]|nr:armadillo-type protein [Cunninghamella echinulata]